MGLFAVIRKIANLPIYEGYQSPRWFLKRLDKDPHFGNKFRMVCIGDSITHGLVSVDYVALLRNNLDNSQIQFLNAGINGELAYNVLQRLDTIIQCKPDFVSILIGTNDIHRSYGKFNRWKSKIQKHLPKGPTKDFYRETLLLILERLKAETPAKIAILSLPTIGELPDEYANQLTAEYSTIVGEIATSMGIKYLPLHETMNEYLTQQPPPKTKSLRWQVYLTIKAILQSFLFNRTLDQIGAKNGFYLHSDHLHLNSKGSQMAAALIQNWINEEKKSD